MIKRAWKGTKVVILRKSVDWWVISHWWMLTEILIAWVKSYERWQCLRLFYSLQILLLFSILSLSNDLFSSYRIHFIAFIFINLNSIFLRHKYFIKILLRVLQLQSSVTIDWWPLLSLIQSCVVSLLWIHILLMQDFLDDWGFLFDGIDQIVFSLLLIIELNLLKNGVLIRLVLAWVNHSLHGSTDYLSIIGALVIRVVEQLVYLNVRIIGGSQSFVER